jgi:phosphoglycerate dehydrogenase-like enzyme
MISPALNLVSQLQLEGLEEQVRNIVPGANIIHIGGTDPVPDNLRADVLLTLGVETQNLSDILRPQHGIRWIHAFGTGVDGFPIHKISDQQLSCSRGATAVPIAEWVLAMLLSAAKCLPDMWAKGEPPAQWNFAPLQPLKDTRLALVGFGGIGQAVAKRALAFDMRVTAMVRTQRPSTMEGVTLVDNWESLVDDADALVIAAPATQETHHLLNRETLAIIKPGLHVINVARGSLIDQDALREALDDGTVALASLDVVDPEPLPPEHWIYQHPSVRMSPHISWNSPAAFSNMLAVFLDNIDHYQQGRVLKGVVDVGSGY